MTNMQKNRIWGASLLALALTACATETAPPETSEVEEAETSVVETVFPEMASYDAAAFYETTSYRMGSAAGFSFSADGSKILISSDETGIFNVRALNHETGEITPITSSAENSTYAVSYFPGSDNVIYTHDNGGDELNHVYAYTVEQGEIDLTPTEETKAYFGGWSDDGDTLFIMTNERDSRFFDAYAYDAASFDRELIYQNDVGYSLDAVSGSGDFIAATKSRNNTDSDVFLIDVSGDEPVETHVTPHEGNVEHGVYDFTPDGSSLVYSTNEFGEFNQAWSYDIESGEKAVLVAEDWDVSYVSFSDSGKYRVTGINEDARTTVKIYDTEAGEHLALDLPHGAIGNIRFSRDETKIALMLSRDTSPNNAVIVDLTTGDAKVLTDALNPAIEEENLVEAEIVRYPSFDGLDIPSVLYKPKNASAENPVPALVWVHGGPGGQSRAGYSAMIQHLVNHGYAILAANNRGSSGYGKTFYHMDDKKHGEVDLQDIVYGEKWLAEQDWVDADKIGIIGGSYGGYMVGAALAFEPEVFKVGINIFGVMNWVRTLESIPPWWESFKEALYDEMGDPATDAERHRAISPLFHAENIQVPLMVIQGANDPRVLKVESDEIVEAVRANGVPVDYVVFDDEGHGFSKKVNRIAASEAYLAFLDTYLKAEEAAAE